MTNQNLAKILLDLVNQIEALPEAEAEIEICLSDAHTALSRAEALARGS